jgi:hypothetical protein
MKTTHAYNSCTDMLRNVVTACMRATVRATCSRCVVCTAVHYCACTKFSTEYHMYTEYTREHCVHAAVPVWNYLP